MAMSLRLTRFACSVRALSCPQVRAMSGGEWGSGKGKGGGAGGTVRDAGGSFGKMEAAHEEEYFRRQQQEQLKAMRDHHRDELKAHQHQIKAHEKWAPPPIPERLSVIGTLFQDIVTRKKLKDTRSRLRS